jgi:hypothetical protein
MGWQRQGETERQEDRARERERERERLHVRVTAGTARLERKSGFMQNGLAAHNVQVLTFRQLVWLLLAYIRLLLRALGTRS